MRLRRKFKEGTTLTAAYKLGYYRGYYTGENGGRVKNLERQISRLRLELEQAKTKQYFGF